MTVEHKAVKLKAQDLEDLTVISSILQDALVPLSDIQFTPTDGNFIMVVNRFCWEDVKDRETEEPFRRVLAGLRVTDVAAVAYRGIDRNEQDRVLELLTLAYCEPDGDVPGHLVLHFAGGGAIRLTLGKLVAAMEDLGDSWPTRWKPGHDEAAGD